MAYKKSTKYDHLIGQTIGRWAVLRKATRSTWGDTRLYCRCVCGTERYVVARTLALGLSTSCGCGQRAKTVQKHLGKRYGLLTVLSYYGQDKHKRNVFMCRCDCGNETPVALGNLISGNTRSCGCVHRKQKGN